MKNHPGTAAFILAAFVTSAAQATSPVPLIWCDGCTGTQMQAAALTQDLGSVYVGNLATHSAQPAKTV